MSDEDTNDLTAIQQLQSLTGIYTGVYTVNLTRKTGIYTGII